MPCRRAAVASTEQACAALPVLTPTTLARPVTDTGFVEERVQKVQEYNLSATLQKPFTIDQLSEVIRRILPVS